MNELINGSERQCPVCGKRYLITCRFDEWGYGYGKRLMCSYHCMREYQRRKEGYGSTPSAMSAADAKKREREIIDLYTAGLSRCEVAARVMASPVTVDEVLKRYGVTLAAVKETRNAEIRRMRDEGMTIRDIADKLCIHEHTVRKALTPRTVTA